MSGIEVSTHAQHPFGLVASFVKTNKEEKCDFKSSTSLFQIINQNERRQAKDNRSSCPPANEESSKVGGTQSLLDEMKNRPPQRGKGDDKDKVDEDTKKSNLNLLLSEMVKKYTSQHAKTKRKSRPMSDGIIGQVDELETLVRA